MIKIIKSNKPNSVMIKSKMALFADEVTVASYHDHLIIERASMFRRFKLRKAYYDPKYRYYYMTIISNIPVGNYIPDTEMSNEDTIYIKFETNENSNTRGDSMDNRKCF